MSTKRTREPKDSEIVRPDQKGKTALKNVCFIDSIPGEDDADGLVILIDGSLRKYIKCDGINALLFDEMDRQSLAKTFATFADTCETTIQIMVRARALPVDDFLSSYQAKAQTQNEYLNWYADYTDKWFRRVQDVHFIPQREFYVVVTYQPPKQNDETNKSFSERDQQRAQQAIDRLTKTAFDQLRASSLRPKILSKKEVRNLIYSELNPMLARKEPEAPPAVAGVSEASILAASGLKVSEENIWLDGRYIATQTLKQIPNTTWMGWLVDLLTLSVEYTMSIFIHPINSNEQKADRLFDISLYISTLAENPVRLAQQTAEIRRVFNSRGATLDREQLSQLTSWQSTLSVAVDKRGAVHRVSSKTLGTFWPFFTASCGTPDGMPFGFALASREPVPLNPFFRGLGKDTNNMLIVGGAGAGKSFAVSLMFLRLLPMGTRFIAVDKTVDKNSGYRFITEILGPEVSSYVDLGQSPGETINPFDLSSEDTHGEPSSEKIAFLLTLFELMLTPDDQKAMSLQEKALLEKMIRISYSDAKKRGTVPTLSDLFEVTARAATDEHEPHLRNVLGSVARNLSLLTKKNGGILAQFLDGKTTFDAEKLFIVFDTRELDEPRLERVAQFVATEFIRRQAANYKARQIKFATVIDQADTWMSTATGAQLLDKLSRQSRHYGMTLICIAQQIGDFFKQAEVASSVVKNSHVKLLLRQDPSELNTLKETLQLSDSELAAVEKFTRDEEKRRDSQCLLMVGNIHGTIRLVPSPMDYWICTSEANEDIPKRLDKFKEIKRENPNLNNTDAARRTVYYLGIGHEGL
ncbi:MAG TPA: ATP-binding protein [Drouetiella sp.]